jgi:hypothetical protein
MPMREHTVDDLCSLLQTGPDMRVNKLNKLILERVITGKDNPEQLIGLSKKVLPEINCVIENERVHRDSLVAYYQVRANQITIPSYILQTCITWKFTQANRDKEKAMKAMEAMKAKEDRARDRQIAPEAKAHEEKQTRCAEENRLLGDIAVLSL